MPACGRAAARRWTRAAPVSWPLGAVLLGAWASHASRRPCFRPCRTQPWQRAPGAGGHCVWRPRLSAGPSTASPAATPLSPCQPCSAHHSTPAPVSRSLLGARWGPLRSRPRFLDISDVECPVTCSLATCTSAHLFKSLPYFRIGYFRSSLRFPDVDRFRYLICTCVFCPVGCLFFS